jgi:hypothetical protein
MLLAFGLGASSVVTMAALTLFMFWELTPWGAAVVRISGYALIALGIVVMAGPVQLPFEMTVRWPV